MREDRRFQMDLIPVHPQHSSVEAPFRKLHNTTHTTACLKCLHKACEKPWNNDHRGAWCFMA